MVVVVVAAVDGGGTYVNNTQIISFFQKSMKMRINATICIGLNIRMMNKIMCQTVIFLHLHIFCDVDHFPQLHAL